MAVEESVDQMQIARSAAAGANREIAGQVRFSAGREGGYLFVPDVHPLDVSAAAHDVGQAVETIADDAEYALHSARHEGIYELIGDGSSHLLLLESVAAIYFAVIECCPLDAP
jgi:hypothetical protein